MKLNRRLEEEPTSSSHAGERRNSVGWYLEEAKHTTNKVQNQEGKAGTVLERIARVGPPSHVNIAESGATTTTTTSSSSRSAPVSRLQFENPLQNKEILETLFGFCSAIDLKNCRLVGSKLWLEAFLNSWRDKAVLKIKFQDNDKKGLGFADFQSKFEEEEHPFQLQRKQFRNVSLKGLEVNGDHPELNWILEKCSGHLRSVTFADCQFSTVKSFMDILLLKLPNIVELRLAGDIAFKSVHRGDKGPYPNHEKLKNIILAINSMKIPFTFPWKALFKSVGNLENLTLESRYLSKSGEGKQVMRAVDDIRHRDRSKLNIKNLEISPFYMVDPNALPDDFGSLMWRPRNANDALPLERFTGSMVDVDHLLSYSNTLKFLNVFFTKDEEYKKNTTNYDDSSDMEPENDSHSENDKGPGNATDNIDDINEDGKVSLPRLKELHVQGTPARVFKNLNKVTATNLETLVLDDVPSSVIGKRWDSYDDHISFKYPSFGNVTRFECDFWYIGHYCFGIREFKRLAQAMPKMMHARIAIAGEAFTVLCEAWPELRTLTVLSSYANPFWEMLVDDAAITGFRPCGDPGKANGRFSNITDLKKLTDFNNPYKLSDFSIYHGFLETPRLHYLKASFKQISKEAKAALKKKVNILEFQDW